MVEIKSAAGMEAMRETGRAPAAVRGHAAVGVGLITACVPGGGLRRRSAGAGAFGPSVIDATVRPGRTGPHAP